MKSQKQLTRTRQNKLERNRKKRKGRTISIISKQVALIVKEVIFAPEDFSLFGNYKGCLDFFHKIRHSESRSIINGRRIVKISLSEIKQIDFSAICIFKSISLELNRQGILLNCNLPIDSLVRKYCLESGLLNHMYGPNHKRFEIPDGSDEIIFQSGTGKLTALQSKKLSKIVRRVKLSLTGTEGRFTDLRAILLEIAGNSIEHAYDKKGSWSLEVKYEKEKVIFTITDVGSGILETLNRTFGVKFFEMFQSSKDILEQAFDKKYGSSTEEVNRNRGLPAVKSAFENGFIGNLKVLTNDVLLCFDPNQKSVSLGKSENKFRGTVYYWEINMGCIKNYDGKTL